MPERILLRDETRPEAAARAAAVLKAGGVAVLPAEGVYGYHALPASARGVERISALKRRDPAAGGKGWIGLVGKPEDAYRWIRALPAPAATLIRARWPGPLTLVLPAGPSAPESLRSADGTIAIRCPGSAFLREVVLAAGGLLLSTSANDPGGAPAVRADGPAADAPGVDLVVDAGPLSGEVSTIVRFEGETVQVLRAGAVAIDPGGEAPLDPTRNGP